MLEKLLEAARSAAAEGGEMKLVISTLVSVQEPLSVNAIAGLLSLDLAHVVSNLLRWILPALRVSPTDSQAIYLDESFIEYLSSSPRINEMLLEKGERNLQLAYACFKVISLVDPPFNICNLESSYLGDREVAGLSERVEEAIPPELLYACRRWAGHTRLVGRVDNIFGDLELFLSTRMLLWMEILNLKGSQRKLCSDGLQELVEDAYQFVESFSLRAIASSTPHIYISQLWFWPQHTRIGQVYHDRLNSSVNCSRGHGHTDWVRSVAFSPDGAYIASGSDDNTIRIWDACSGKPVVQPLTGHTKHVNSVVYSPDGAYIASGSDDDTIRIWDARTGKLVGQPLIGHTNLVYSVAYSPDGVYIASGSWDHTIHIWDARTGEPVGQPIIGHVQDVCSVAYSPDGAYIVSGSNDRTIRIWEAVGRRSRRLGVRSRAFPSVYSSCIYIRFWGIAPPNHVLQFIVVAWSRRSRPCTTEAHTGKPVGQPLTGHREWVRSVTYSPDGAYIASGSDDKTIRIWDALTGRLVGQPLTGHTDNVRSVAYSPNGAYIVSGSWDKTIRIWDARTGKPMGQPLTGHTYSVSSVAYSPDGAYIVSGSGDSSVHIWFAPTWPEPKLVQPPTSSRQPAIRLFRRSFWAVPKSADRATHSPRPNHRHKANRMLKQQATVITWPITASPLGWTLNEDGWVVGPSEERLIWVPLNLRDKVASPSTKAIISRKPGVAFDFHDTKLGLDWQDCFNPS
ncbi:POC1 centriolar protein A [Ceratobasidium sp. 428]|nr:POC1 centriolar protein A [Ceratobasidium sp. 428]